MNTTLEKNNQLDSKIDADIASADSLKCTIEAVVKAAESGDAGAPALTGQGVSTVWRKLSTDPDYPTTVRLGNRCTRVRMGDIRKLIQARVVYK